jgi:periplasmic divalent cation tolerance protein
MSEERAIVVLVTAGSAENAGVLARTLVEERLAACVNVVPGVRSVYRWQGQVVDEGEWLLVAKARRSSFAALEARVRELHTYDTPEVIALDVALGSVTYLDWIRRETV